MNSHHFTQIAFVAAKKASSETIIHESIKDLQEAVSSMPLEVGEQIKTTVLITRPLFRVQTWDTEGQLHTHLAVLEGEALLQWAKNYIG